MKKYNLFILVSIVLSYGSLVCMEDVQSINQLNSADIKKMIAMASPMSKCDDIVFPRYVQGRNEHGIHIIDIRKQYEQLCLDTRFTIQQNTDSDDLQVKLKESNK